MQTGKCNIILISSKEANHNLLWCTKLLIRSLGNVYLPHWTNWSFFYIAPSPSVITGQTSENLTLLRGRARMPAPPSLFTSFSELLAAIHQNINKGIQTRSIRSDSMSMTYCCIKSQLSLQENNYTNWIIQSNFFMPCIFSAPNPLSSLYWSSTMHLSHYICGDSNT